MLSGLAAVSANEFAEVALGGLITVPAAVAGVAGCLFVVWFSKDVKALDTMDFWAGTVPLLAIGLMALVAVIFLIITFCSKRYSIANLSEEP